MDYLLLFAGVALGFCMGWLITDYRSLSRSDTHVKELSSLIDRVGKLEIDIKGHEQRLDGFSIKISQHADAIKEIDKYIHEVL